MLYHRRLGQIAVHPYREIRALLRELGVQFSKFAGVGVVGTVGHYAVLIALVNLAGTNPVFSSGVGAVVGTAINYALNHKCTFASTERHRISAPKFVMVSLVGILINLLMMYLFTDVFGAYYLFAQVLATSVVLIWNFLGNRFWTFRGDLAIR